IDLPPEVYGTLEVFAYRNAADGFPVRKTRVLYIRPPGQINIETTLDKKEYRPGNRARLLFALTGLDGNAIPGALTLAAVDEAVFSVLDQETGMEQYFYTVEQDLLRPVLSDWSPTAMVEGPAAEQQRFEQALFARVANQKKGVDREAFLKQLLPFVENNPRAFDVLKLPDWEKRLRQIDPDLMPQEAIATLRNDPSFHTLNSSTYPENARKTEALKTASLEVIKGLWAIYAIVGCVSLLILFVIALAKFPNLRLIIIPVCFLALLV